MKIALIGGGSVQWTPKLVTDIALTEMLAGATLALHDIDGGALSLLTRTSEQIATQTGDRLKISATLDRTEALHQADFVILCVSIGGLAAMRHDLEIPERYGLYQPVGDTVGPGGLTRGLRHIPFAVQVAREMEQLCPDAWLLNLTNPMTTLCRSITRATGIKTIGLCHEVGGLRRRLAKLFAVPADTISFDVAGINHLPVILKCRIGPRDGLAMLGSWLAEHGRLALTDQHGPDPIQDIFEDRFGVKLTLLEQLGILFGAGDRHVAEFFAGFLSEASGFGRDYCIVLTKISHREQLAAWRRNQIEQWVEQGVSENLRVSDEQLAPVMAALAGGPSGQFVTNLPNTGQIDNLPREAVVECIAEIDRLGVRPLATGTLPLAAYAAIAPHVARQELIVEAALTGQNEPALAALASDPLVRNSATVKPMFAELMAANALFMEPAIQRGRS
jgi:alpha-galactosidase